MATVIVKVPLPPVVVDAAKKFHGKHPNLMVRGLTSNKTVTVPYAPQAGSRSGQAPVYVRQPRPGRDDLVIRNYEGTTVLALNFYFADPDYLVDSEDGITALETLADSEEAVVLHHCSPHWGGPWYITELTWDDAELQPFTNRVTRTTAHVTFTLATDATLAVGPTSGGVTSTSKHGSSHHHKKSRKRRKRTPKVYVVRRGDTLSGIAARELHNAHLWGRIASLNHLRNPNRIYPGQRLRLP